MERDWLSPPPKTAFLLNVSRIKVHLVSCVPMGKFHTGALVIKLETEERADT